MFIYNQTIKVDWTIEIDWLLWMKEEQIPDMLATALFYKYQLVRLVGVEEEDGPTYAIQYFAHTKEAYEKFMEVSSQIIHQRARKKWLDKFVMFETLMEVIN